LHTKNAKNSNQIKQRTSCANLFRIALHFVALKINS